MAVATPVTHASRIGDMCGSPMPSSSWTCSSSMRCGFAITSVASACADSDDMPLAS